LEVKINTYSEKFKVRSYEVDVTGRVTVLTISNFLQEIAGNHAGELGVSVDKLFEKNMTWVLSRLHLQMYSYPFWREMVNVETWPSDAYGKFATRDFEIYNSKHKLIGKATSSWMLIDLKKMRPITMPDFIMSIERPEKPRAIKDNFEKLPQLEKIEYKNSYKVRLSDLDINQHVNNVNYIEWAIETIPVAIRKKFMLSEIEISFRSQGKYGDSVESRVQKTANQDGKTFIHSLVHSEVQVELAVALSKWHKI
jgi:acyl-ACP thioesterase